MKNVRSAHVFDLKLLRKIYLLFSWRDLLQNSFVSGNIYRSEG